ncbi:uncharacterized protein BT62DRAFT_938261 [Guyanagaster necrorhizus]|uniref:Uncharacterized protein n=1 Tax=Guyanagaster necrorhizus TaxID=856835 RepID=A0A9P8ALZ6_9AGAR|nr:uncharacterized protein BT62DRAFT_938261 [Guyanagaster necrorhizus MCA 3950]KAG7440194.1 hypothetical protein BT62DRAFT_938261 [Guyanagaster necrorhizus MCA 3950]
MPYYGPDEPYKTIMLERYFLAGDVVVGLGFGIQTVLYVSCATYLWKRRKQNPIALFLLAYITLLLSIEAIFVGVQANTVQMIYIDNRNYPGGPWQFFLDTQNLAVNVIFYATLFVMTFLSDILVLWRCWVIWTASGQIVAYVITAFPAITLLASFVMGTLWTLQSSQPGLSFYSALPLAYGTSYYSISLGLNIILTILIILRLYMYRRRLLTSLPPEHAHHYVSLATIIIESAALYSIFAILFLVTYAVGHPSNQIFLGVASSTQQISGYLIIYRLAEGRAWKKSTLNTLPLTSMNFGSPPVCAESGTATHLGTIQLHTLPANNGAKEEDKSTDEDV